MPWPKLLIKGAVLAGKVATSLGLPYILPVRRPQPPAVRAVKWYFLLVVLPALFLLDPASPASLIIAGVGMALGTWAMSGILYNWWRMRRTARLGGPPKPTQAPVPSDDLEQ